MGFGACDAMSSGFVFEVDISPNMVAHGQCDSESRENEMGISRDQINIHYGRIVSEASFCLTENMLP